MERFTKIESVAAPLPLKDVDTDLIIPAQYLTSTSKQGYGEHLFARLRTSDPSFFLNLPKYAGSQILICGDNFGCGSSREHAVWALMGAGFRVLIGTDFADIFSGNSAKNGLLLISLPAKDRDNLMNQALNGEFVLSIDLESLVIAGSDNTEIKFSYDPFRRSCLLNGFDDVDYLLSYSVQIDKYFSRSA